MPPRPTRSQYDAMKASNPNKILIYRVGDHYEAFGDDARIMAPHLDRVLDPAIMTGLPAPLGTIYPAYLERILSHAVATGKCVAVCEAITDTAAGPVFRVTTEDA